MKKSILLLTIIYALFHQEIVATQEEENVEILYYGKPMENITAKRVNRFFNKVFID